MAQQSSVSWTAYVGGTGDAPDFYVKLSDAKPHLLMPLSLGLDGGRAAAQLIAAVPDLLAAAKAVEWGAEVDAQEDGFVAGCPCCGAEKRTGKHFQDCALSAAITKAEGR